MGRFDDLAVEIAQKVAIGRYGGDGERGLTLDETDEPSQLFFTYWDRKLFADGRREPMVRALCDAWSRQGLEGVARATDGPAIVVLFTTKTELAHEAAHDLASACAAVGAPIISEYTLVPETEN